MARRGEFVWFLPFAALVAALQLAAATLSALLDRPAPCILLDYYARTFVVLPLLFAVWIGFRTVALGRARDPAPLATLIQQGAMALRDPEAVIARAGALLLMPAAMAAIGVLKMLLPDAVGGFFADAALARFDRALFLGTDPWRITHALLGGTAATVVIDRLYTLWVPLLGVATGFFALFAAPAERSRFFLTYLLCWVVLGTLGAFVGASAGPCFVARLGLPEAQIYADLIERLRAIDQSTGLGAFQWQDQLWTAYAERRLEFAMGISAMPSMHVSIATLYALVARRYGPGAYRAALAFAGVTLVGSVHLGWHYAADGLVSMAGTTLLWKIVNVWLARREAAVGASAGPATALA